MTVASTWRLLHRRIYETDEKIEFIVYTFGNLDTHLPRTAQVLDKGRQ